MKKKRNHLGFTLAELLIVVAIVGVLAGVSFVAVQTYQRNLNQVELDTVAKEIFVAAQNHLTMARNEGYLGMEPDKDAEASEKEAFYGIDGKLDGEEDVYFFSVNDGLASAYIFNLILPSYALDSTILAGNYGIRYQPSSGLVLDVFYTSPTGKYKVDPLPDFEDLVALRGEDKKGARRDAYVGWYGGTEAASLPHSDYTLVEPELEVNNGDKLWVKIKDNNESAKVTIKEDYKIALLMTGTISRVQHVFKLEEAVDVASEDAAVARMSHSTDDKGNVYIVILDDITSPNMHFADFEEQFIPGEDIVLRAVAYNMAALSKIAHSDEKTVNSLFEKADNADGRDDADEKATPWSPITAYINNFRHLENLDKNISNVNYSPATAGPNVVAAEGTKPLSVKAVQTTDLEWEADGDVFNDETVIYKETGGQGEPGCFVPVVVPATYTVSDAKISIAYHGVEIPEPKDDTLTELFPHSIKGITVNVTGAASAGLFGDLPNGSSVMDLVLIDFTVTSASGSAGALAGTLAQNDALGSGSVNVSYVVAYNTGKAATATITSAGDVGGLIGKVTGGNAVIEKSAAALAVKSTGADKSAGGLIGTMEGGTVTGCYSGGHTYNGGYYDASNKPIYNVQAANETTGTGTAGGLIGVATNMGDVSACYSTCSVRGKVAGGFAGTYTGATGKKLEDCYATGLVCGTDTETKAVTVTNNGKSETKNMTLPKDGAFAYSLTGAAVSGCWYYELINERVETEGITGGNKTYTVSATVPSTMTSKDSFTYLTALGGYGGNAGIAKLDATADSYDEFVGAPSTWTRAVPYDSKLLEYYSVKNKDDDLEGRFNLQSVERLLGADLKKNVDDTMRYYVKYHYGDWPAPEIFVVNAAS